LPRRRRRGPEIVPAGGNLVAVSDRRFAEDRVDRSAPGTVEAIDPDFRRGAPLVGDALQRRQIEGLVAPGGVLSVVLQLPSTTEPAVGSSPVASVQAHRNSFHFVDVAALTQELERSGFSFVRSVDRPLPAGKAFWLGFFKRSA